MRRRLVISTLLIAALAVADALVARLLAASDPIQDLGAHNPLTALLCLIALALRICLFLLGPGWLLYLLTLVLLSARRRGGGGHATTRSDGAHAHDAVAR